MTEAQFPALKPALTALIEVDPPIGFGPLAAGSGLNVAPFVGGTLKSEPAFGTEVDAVNVTGSDFIRVDPSGEHLRLNVTSVWKNKDGTHISYSYTGVIEMTPAIGAVLGGSPDAKTVPFGNIFSHVVFETSGDKLKELDHGVYVASGRFVVREGKPLGVEYKISKLIL